MDLQHEQSERISPDILVAQLIFDHFWDGVISELFAYDRSTWSGTGPCQHK